MQNRPTYVGVDVSKARLEVACRPSGELFDGPNDEPGIGAIVERLRELAPALVVLEATGGFEMPLAAALALAGLPCAIVNPRQVRDFAKACGQLAKTDRLDAQMLARFGEAVKPEPRPLHGGALAELSALVLRRRQLSEMLVAERNRLCGASERVRDNLARHIEGLTALLREVDDEMGDAIRRSPAWRERDDLLRSVPGVGPTVSRTLMAELPELGRLSHKQLAKLAGVAPLNCDSGPRSGARRIWGGRAPVRTALYMAALVACRWNPVIKGYYEGLLLRGKAKKVALVACMRKLLTILNAMAKHGTAWDAGFAHRS
jgi:transposase